MVWRRFGGLVAALAVGLALRGAVLVFYLGTHGGREEVWEDGRIAANLVAGKGYVLERLGVEWRSYHVPVYPLILALLWRLSGSSFALVHAFQLLSSLALIGCVYASSRRWIGERAGLAAAWIVAVEPGLIIYGSYKLVPVVLSALWVVLWLHFFFVADEDCDARAAVAAGVLLGIGILTRPDLGVLGASMIVWWAWARRPWRWVARVAIPITLVAGGILLPWLFRNYRIHHKILLTTDSAEARWLGNNPRSTGTLWDRGGAPMGREAERALAGLPGPRTELGVHQWFKEEASRWIIANPAQAGRGFLRKLFFSWWFSPDYATRRYEWIPRPVLWAYKALYGMLLLAALMGTVKARRSLQAATKRLVLVGVAVAVGFSLIHAVFYAEGRHRIVVMPIIAMLAACGWHKNEHECPDSGGS